MAASIAGTSQEKGRRCSGAATARLSGEAAESQKKLNDGIWCRPVMENDLLRWDALVLGPALSPYSFGFFSFRMTFSEEYPSTAPSVVITTTGGAKTRFNPNLYADGKVCLSTLGTWRGESGEMWSSAQSIQSIMVSIQSLMDDQPFHNEPGFEKEAYKEGGKASKRAGRSQQSLADLCKSYNQKITHESLRIAVCDVLEDLFKPDSDKLCSFPEVIKWHFLLYHQAYLDIAEANKDVTGQFDIMEFEYSRNEMAGSFDFGSLKERLDKIWDQLMLETRGWERKGEEMTAKGTDSYECQQVNMALQKFGRVPLEEVSASPQSTNMFVWDVTFMGGLDGGWWENGIYSLTLVFPPDFPDTSPRPKFETVMFHPQISKEGYPFVGVSLYDWKNVTSIVQDIHNILRNPPNPDPRTWVNKDAANLYFNEGDKGREEYARQVRKCAQRSME
uniref:UBC core domain-containing protein n=3 Tax=Hemiselmis andersenii TaxID=464988 RepID=A0A6U4LDK1_HEMAN|mmetsp:Transcript_59173/g.142583  ORF Transcript_59173/g.142583 Transcript_59173/m.142583 type:complete len:447 (+) Transcript_59173:32-1372(+)